MVPFGLKSLLFTSVFSLSMRMSAQAEEPAPFGQCLLKSSTLGQKLEFLKLRSFAYGALNLNNLDQAVSVVEHHMDGACFRHVQVTDQSQAEVVQSMYFLGVLAAERLMMHPKLVAAFSPETKEQTRLAARDE